MRDEVEERNVVALLTVEASADETRVIKRGLYLGEGYTDNGPLIRSGKLLLFISMFQGYNI